eukprot:scaffold5749_cov104-Isochrysis_galbana.AAC.2
MDGGAERRAAGAAGGTAGVAIPPFPLNSTLPKSLKKTDQTLAWANPSVGHGSARRSRDVWDRARRRFVSLRFI